jgi:dihydrofolate reductase
MMSPAVCISGRGANDIKVSLVVAVARNGVIGRDGGLPWRLSSDLKRFKANTIGRPVIMGRKTFKSIGKALPGRENIVVTRDAGFRADGVSVESGIADALSAAKAKAAAGGVGEICVIGGGEIYRQTIKDADRLIVTYVEADVDGDTRFPDIDPSVWLEISSESHPASEKDSHATRHVVYERRF